MSDLDDRIKSASTTAKADFSAQMGISALEKEGASAARELIDRLKLLEKVYVDLNVQAETLNKHTKAGESDRGSAQNNPTGPNTTVYVYGLTDRDFGTWFVESFLDPDPEASVRTGPMEIEL